MKYSAGAPVEVIEYDQERPLRQYRSHRVSLERTQSAMLGQPAFDLVLEDYEVQNLTRPGPVNRRAQITVFNLSVPGGAGQTLLDLSSANTTGRIM